VVLKHDALDAQALGRPDLAEPLWRALRHRFPSAPATADALYALGRQRPALRSELLRQFPAHPAALAAALEAGPSPAARLGGALHLARWGVRWPGAEGRLREVCGPAATGPDPSQRRLLAQGLAELGDARGALGCLGAPGTPAAAAAFGALSNAGRLSLAKAQLRGDPAEQRSAERLLLAVAQAAPNAPEAEEAVRLLSQQEGPEITAALQQLPARWRDSAPVAAHRALASAVPVARGARDGDDRAGLAVLRRWPTDPASWDLQWELARRRLLQGRWSEAATLLGSIDAGQLPPSLAARLRFWQGYVQRQLGQDEQATATWRELRLHHPGGYYGWRAAVQLGADDLSLAAGGKEPIEAWYPLASGDGELDLLWRLDQRTEAWEGWRHRRGNLPPRASKELLVEGRLRQGVGDDWTGFAQLEQANLRLLPEECDLQPQLERSLHPPRFLSAFEPVAAREGLPVALLLGVAKQESRFTPAVHSAAGAVGLMQVLPSTASELAGAPVSAADLENPERNVQLGGLYLRRLLTQWKGDPLPAVASYNAGPGAVQDWIGPRLKATPELWVEAIPFPETRLYVKKVLGNTWSYQQSRPPRC
jgi:soluble lytic murein transglycosylase